MKIVNNSQFAQSERTAPQQQSPSQSTVEKKLSKITH